MGLKYLLIAACLLHGPLFSRQWLSGCSAEGESAPLCQIPTSLPPRLPASQPPRLPPFLPAFLPQQAQQCNSAMKGGEGGSGWCGPLPCLVAVIRDVHWEPVLQHEGPGAGKQGADGVSRYEGQAGGPALGRKSNVGQWHMGCCGTRVWKGMERGWVLRVVQLVAGAHCNRGGGVVRAEEGGKASAAVGGVVRAEVGGKASAAAGGVMRAEVGGVASAEVGGSGDRSSGVGVGWLRLARLKDGRMLKENVLAVPAEEVRCGGSRDNTDVSIRRGYFKGMGGTWSKHRGYMGAWSKE
ncbi:unnamed protein product [Closterium sp. Naga37s-1]|nr:unnamed protein product [Closterium sp. Naga37s-1]